MHELLRHKVVGAVLNSMKEIVWLEIGVNRGNNAKMILVEDLEIKRKKRDIRV